MSIEPLLLLLALGLAILLQAREKDIASMRRAIRALAKGEPCAKGLHFSSREADRLWENIQSIFQSRREREQRGPNLAKVLHLGNEIAQNLDEELDAANRACRLLLRETSPESKAVALLLLDGEGESRLFCAEGVLGERVLGTLLVHLQNRRDREGARDCRSKDFEHLAPRNGDLLDFSLLGLGASAFVYLRSEGEIIGAFWIAFSSTSAQLLPERLALLQGIAEHCAHSFLVARQFEDRLSESSLERNWLIGMSHDLRSPGNNALYALQDLLSEQAGLLNKEQRLRLRIVESSLHDQIELLNDILDLARNREGLLEARKEFFSLQAVFDPLLRASLYEARRKNLRFSWTTVPDIACYCDPKHFKRILGNLLGNALKYTDRGGIEIFIEQEAGMLRISVTDSGIGVPEPAQQKLFQKFTRFQNAAARQGVGLGLNVAKTLAEINSGKLEYREVQGGGSCFSLLLPLVGLRQTQTQAISNGGVLRILLVDDDDLTLRTHTRFFLRPGVEVATARSSIEAIEKAKSLAPHIVLSDLHLGEENSEVFLQFLKSQMPVVKIFLTTGSGDSRLLQHLEARYSLRILEKPLNRQSIENLFFSGHSSARAAFSSADTSKLPAPVGSDHQGLT